MNARNGIASSNADRSGSLIAHDFGAISPSNTCSRPIPPTAMISAITSPTPSGTWISSNNGCSRCATAGSDNDPRPKVHKVIPS